MEIKDLSSQLLKYMVSYYHENGKNCFNYRDLAKIFSNVKDHELKATLYALKNDSFISIDDFNNQPQLIFLKVKTIIEIKEYFITKRLYC